MGAVIEFPGRTGDPVTLPPTVVEVLLDYFAMRVEQLTPGSPDRLRVEAVLKRAGR